MTLNCSGVQLDNRKVLLYIRSLDQTFLAFFLSFNKQKINSNKNLTTGNFVTKKIVLSLNQMIWFQLYINFS